MTGNEVTALEEVRKNVQIILDLLHGDLRTEKPGMVERLRAVEVTCASCRTQKAYVVKVAFDYFTKGLVYVAAAIWGYGYFTK